jgi:hypothetical protein
MQRGDTQMTQTTNTIAFLLMAGLIFFCFGGFQLFM